ncbi:hypothetical protein CCACVL1_15004 [Corchorus capsularis]|uniref:Uncharacterized protein n=1 Tax=Corchorus capsularis TaxID=210143 RepID=A0A1R3I4H0_COCAP|nr:hypothetical protein CCACVL1_15004 [Corchorus capsularis]
MRSTPLSQWPNLVITRLALPQMVEAGQLASSREEVDLNSAHQLYKLICSRADANIQRTDEVKGCRQTSES